MITTIFADIVCDNKDIQFENLHLKIERSDMYHVGCPVPVSVGMELSGEAEAIFTKNTTPEDVTKEMFNVDITADNHTIHLHSCVPVYCNAMYIVDGICKAKFGFLIRSVSPPIGLNFEVMYVQQNERKTVVDIASDADKKLDSFEFDIKMDDIYFDRHEFWEDLWEDIGGTWGEDESRIGTVYVSNKDGLGEVSIKLRFPINVDKLHRLRMKNVNTGGLLERK